VGVKNSVAVKGVGSWIFQWIFQWILSNARLVSFLVDRILYFSVKETLHHANNQMSTAKPTASHILKKIVGFQQPWIYDVCPNHGVMAAALNNYKVSTYSQQQNLPSISVEYIRAKFFSSVGEVTRSGDTGSQLTTCLTGVDVSGSEWKRHGESSSALSITVDCWSSTNLSSFSLAHTQDWQSNTQSCQLFNKWLQTSIIHLTEWKLLFHYFLNQHLLTYSTIKQFNAHLLWDW